MLKSIIIIAAVLLTMSVSTFASTINLEKIFTHDRGQMSSDLRKSARLNDEEIKEYDYIQRAIEDLKKDIPQYTGYYLLDLMFAVMKNLFVFLLSLMVPPGDGTATMDNLSRESNLGSNSNSTNSTGPTAAGRIDVDNTL